MDKIITRFLFVGFTLLFSFTEAVCQQDYRKELSSLYQGIQKRFYDDSTGYYTDVKEAGPDKKYCYLWPLCGLLQASNESEIASLRGLSLNALTTLIEKYKSNKPPVAGYDSYLVEYGGGDRFYDDNQWLGLAWIDAWFRTKSPGLLNKAIGIYRFMITGYDTATGGGLYWEEGNHTSKNTCSNGPGIVLALQLYKATYEKKYLDTALLLYNWVNEHLQDSDYLYFDNIQVKSRRIAKVKYSYNTGVMLQANVYLYDLTKDPVYRQRAERIADNALDYFYGSGKFRDGYWFNAVLLRGYQALLKINPDQKYLRAFKICTNEAIRQNLSAAGLMGSKKPESLVNQAGMLEILARLAID
jgi:uncharacterized protein YyaL (SSP411 family)